MFVRSLLAMVVFASVAHSFLAFAEESPIVFESTRVSAPVDPHASSVWMIATDSATTTEQIEDTDGDGWVHLTREIPAAALIWVVDIQTGRLMTAKREGVFPAPFAFPAAMFVDEPAGRTSQVVYRRTSACQFIWVRPGVGAWQVSRADGADTDRDGVLNGYSVFPVADFLPLHHVYVIPDEIKAGDVFIGVESPAAWFGDKVDGHLSVAGSAGVIGAPAYALGTEGTSYHDISIVRRGGTQGTVSVKYATEDGTAVAGVDYEANSGTLVFGPGEDYKEVKIRIRDDGLIQGSRSFKIRYSEPAGTTVLRTVTEFDIGDNELPALVDFVLPSSRTEGNAPIERVPVEIEVRSVGTRLHPTTVKWRVEAPGMDEEQTGTVTIAPDETRKNITVSYKGDMVPNGERRIWFSFGQITNARYQGGTRSIPIIDDDFAEIEVGDVRVIESKGTARVPISATVKGHTYIHGQYTVTGGSATAGTDYVVKSGPVILGVFQTVQMVEIPLRDDEAVEPDEWFTVVLSDVTGGVVAKNAGVVSIIDDDPTATRTPTIVIDDWAGVEGDSAQFSVRLSSVAQEEISFNATIRNGTAQAGQDFVDSSRTIVIPAGSTTTTFTVDVVNDAAQESREQFTIELSNASRGTIARGVAVGKIEDDDDPSLPLLTVHGHAASEQYDWQTPAATLRLQKPHTMPVLVTIESEDGSATAGSDYERVWWQVVIEAGDTELPVLIPTFDDSVEESNETFTLRVTAAVNATIATSSAMCVILDNDSTTPPKRRRATRP